MSEAGGNNPRWGPTGSELFYRSDAGNLVAVEVRSTPSFQVMGSQTLFSFGDFFFGLGAFGMDPRGDRFAMLRPLSNSEASYTLLLNFLSEDSP